MESDILLAVVASRKTVETKLLELQQKIYELCHETGAYKTCPFVRDCEEQCRSCPLHLLAIKEIENGRHC